jgi:inosine/xanthosine triphosphatase
MHLFVGSTNPVKINAVTTAASETWPSVTVQGFDVPSGVSVQPIGDEETRSGARNRAVAALDEGIRALKQADRPVRSQEVLGVGLEGGVFFFGEEVWSTVWVAVTDATGALYESNGARFKVPEIIAQRIKNGEEMGPVVNTVIGTGDVRHSIGMIGVITGKFVDRTEEYGGIAKMALGLWYGRDWEKSLR